MPGRMHSNRSMERLLVATDASEAGLNEVATGLEVFKECSSKLDLIAMTVVMTNLVDESALSWVMADAEKEMEQKLEAVREMAKEERMDCKIIAHRGAEPPVESLSSDVCRFWVF